MGSATGFLKLFFKDLLAYIVSRVSAAVLGYGLRVRLGPS